MSGCSGVDGYRFGSSQDSGHGAVAAGDSGPLLSGAGKIEASRVVKTQKVKPGQITGVGIEQLFSLMQNQQVMLVDCRPGIYYHLGHIQDAIHLPLKKYARSLNTTKGLFDRALKEGKVIVIYCQNLNCPDAYLFAKGISAEGYSVSVYKGGWEEWKASGL
ncbi:MAG: rhodanese-like domain-containing protein [Akkermansiaceae bacterium]